MNRAKTVTGIMRQLKNVRDKRQLRMLRGKLDKQTAHLSVALRDSALREFDRQKTSI